MHRIINVVAPWDSLTHSLVPRYLSWKLILILAVKSCDIEEEVGVV